MLLRPFAQLSGGEQTRLLLAALFLTENCFLLLDEPTDHLDAEGRRLVGRYLNGKRGFVLVSHDRALLESLGLRVVCDFRSAFERDYKPDPELPGVIRQDIAAIRDSGGIIGLNLCLSFIGSESIDALFRHLDYGLQLVGEDAIAFGFDTDGLDRYPDELTLQRSLHEQVIAMMAERGYSDALIRKVAGGKTLRMLERVCP